MCANIDCNLLLKMKHSSVFIWTWFKATRTIDGWGMSHNIYTALWALSNISCLLNIGRSLYSNSNTCVDLTSVNSFYHTDTVETSSHVSCPWTKAENERTGKCLAHYVWYICKELKLFLPSLPPFSLSPPDWSRDSSTNGAWENCQGLLEWRELQSMHKPHPSHCA